MNEQVSGKNIDKRSNGVGKTWLMAFVLLALCTAYPRSLSAQCTPISATLQVSADDVANVWFNGVLVPGGPFGFCSKSTGCSPKSVPVNPALVNGSGVNCLAIRTTNTLCCETNTAWVLDITCSGGMHSYMTSDQIGSLVFYWDPSGAAPPPNNLGLPWQDPNWVNPNPAVYFKDTPVCENEFFWNKRIYSPLTGQWACALAPDQSPQNHSPLNDSYFRQCQPVSMVTPPGPPAFNITKTALGPVSQITSGMPVTYRAVICNTGAAVTSPVTVFDNKPPGFNYGGPWSPAPPQGPYGDPNFIFSEGFPGAPVGGGSACQTLTYWLINYGVNSSDYCQTRYNSVTVVGYSAAATASVTMYCPAPTNTYTSTNTFTPTPTWTNTVPANTPTWTNTFTSTYTFTATPTWTNTFPPGTYTPTNTYTFTPTLSPTPTWTNTITPTPGPACRLFQAAPKLVFFAAPGKKGEGRAGNSIQSASKNYCSPSPLIWLRQGYARQMGEGWDEGEKALINYPSPYPLPQGARVQMNFRGAFQSTLSNKSITAQCDWRLLSFANQNGRPVLQTCNDFSQTANGIPSPFNVRRGDYWLAMNHRGKSYASPL